jgi:hypothetical protein
VACGQQEVRPTRVQQQGDTASWKEVAVCGRWGGGRADLEGVEEGGKAVVPLHAVGQLPHPREPRVVEGLPAQPPQVCSDACHSQRVYAPRWVLAQWREVGSSVEPTALLAKQCWWV